PGYNIKPRRFFVEGRVFAVLFTEAAGSTAVTDYNTAISYVKYDEAVHTQIRRFVVVRAKTEFCFACPIFTYSGQGTMKSGVRPKEHAIAYTWGSTPAPLPGETGLEKAPIPIIGVEGEPPLDRASRIYFGIHHPIQYNVKVRDLGSVYSSYVPTLIGYWSLENPQPTTQDTDVTANA
ncbi:uncharacterized protein BDR25DRAFT_242405, partial [Lindgomyces ingoldianus]